MNRKFLFIVSCLFTGHIICSESSLKKRLPLSNITPPCSIFIRNISNQQVTVYFNAKEYIISPNAGISFSTSIYNRNPLLAQLPDNLTTKVVNNGWCDITQKNNIYD